jgi:hypothetical protein
MPDPAEGFRTRTRNATLDPTDRAFVDLRGTGDLLKGQIPTQPRLAKRRALTPQALVIVEPLERRILDFLALTPALIKGIRMEDVARKALDDRASRAKQ